MLFRCSARPLVPIFIVSLLYAQVAEAPNAAHPTFKAKVQVVLLDVVVSDRHQHPITGLHRDDFELFENGKPQTIASFEEQRGDLPPTEMPHPSLPPHFYSNTPLVEPHGSINVLLLDSLNTDFADQATVRLQMIKYLKSIRPGPRLAIFTLGSRLRMVEGFTADPEALLQALDHKHWGGTPQTSPQLRTSAEDNLDQTLLTRMSESNGMNSGAPASAIGALQDFLAEVQSTEAVTRMSSTLDALEELSRYLSGFQGRKNIIWFSGSFPEIEFPAPSGRARVDPDSGNGLGQQMKDIINRLAATQIAVYPISARGLDTQAFYEASNPSGRARGLQSSVIEGQNQALYSDNVNRYFNQKSADDIAANTGGEAFYNTNGLQDALAKAIAEGAYYYRLSYSPTDKKMLGRYRQIRVSIKDGAHPTPSNIAYRHGYYEENEKRENSAPAELPTDYLHPLMRRGLPDATEIVYNLRLLRSATQPASGATPIGDNKDLHGSLRRISADFVISPADLDFELTPDGVRHGHLELSLVAYDHAGRPLNWVIRSFRTSLKPEVYPSVQKAGVQLHQELDVPNADDLYLRSGIYDLQSNRAGTLEVPLSEVTAEHLSAETQKTAVERSAKSTPTVSSPTQPTPALSGPPAAKGNGGPAVAEASELAGSRGPLPPSAPILEQPSMPVAKDMEASDIPAYCASLASSVEHAAALAKVCEFVLSMRKRLPNVICEREMKRSWKEYRPGWGGGVYEVKHADVLTAQVTYREGQEYYEDVRLDGLPVSTQASILPIASLSGTWSVGEFATVLEGSFLPSSHPEFRFEQQTKVHSVKALCFRFHVAAKNNRSYFLFVGNKVWFPEYSGQLWIDENSFQLLRLKRETANTPQYPIRQVKTSIDYGNVPMGDGSHLVLPVHSEVLTCAPVSGNSNNCSRNIVKFTNWHKFGATTTIVMTPGN